MRRIFSVRRIVLLQILIITALAHAQITLKPEIISPEIGEVIDFRENQMFKIFSTVPEFSWAKFYSKSPQKYYLHLMGRQDNLNKIVILEFDLTKFFDLKQKILKSIEDYKAHKSLGEVYSYTVKEKDWKTLTGMQKFRLTDGNELVGEVMNIQADTLKVRTGAGLTVDIPDSRIEKISSVRIQTAAGKYYRVDPNSSRLFFAPTGRALPKGSGYFADYYIFFPTVAYGFSNNFACAVGMSIFPGASSQLLYLAPKLTFSLQKNVGLSAGMLLMKVPEEGDDVKLGYVVSTFGSDLKGITIGAGFPLMSGGGNEPIILLGGETQVSSRVKLITENWIFTGGDGFTLFSGGIRFFGDRLAVDLAFITAKEAWEEAEGFPFIPYVDFSVLFGK